MKQHIFFDLDGTLTDSAPGILNSLRHAFAGFGLAPSEAVLRSYIGPPLRESFARHFSSAADVERAVRLYRDYFSERGLFENAVYPGIPDMLRRLSVQARLYLATSKPEVFALRIMDYFGLSPFFTGMYGAELNGPRHDKADVLRHALSRHRMASADAVMAGDRRHDVEGAHAVGLPCVGAAYGYGGRAELEAAGAEAVADDVPALERLLCGAVLRREGSASPGRPPEEADG